MTADRPPRPVFARFYQGAGPLMEFGGMTAHRRVLLAGLTGEVIEIGAGTGLNFGYYPPEVTRVVAVEPEPRLRGTAAKAAARVPARVEVTDGVAGRLPVPDASFDAAVVSLVLCSLPDLAAGLDEIRRVVRPGGELRFLEHVADSDHGRRVHDQPAHPGAVPGNTADIANYAAHPRSSPAGGSDLSWTSSR